MLDASFEIRAHTPWAAYRRYRWVRLLALDIDLDFPAKAQHKLWVQLAFLGFAVSMFVTIPGTGDNPW